MDGTHPSQTLAVLLEVGPLGRTCHNDDDDGEKWYWI